MTSRDEGRIYDEYLAAAARAGDRTAFNALARRWEAKLVRHAWRLTGDAEAARDIAQEAWGSIVQGIRRLDDCAAFPAFAFRIVTRRAADHIRASQRRRAIYAAAAAEPSAPDELNENVGPSHALQQALATLPAEQRAAIALFYQEDLSVMEIAVALGVPSGTVKTRLMAAREKLKAALGVEKETINEQA